MNAWDGIEEAGRSLEAVLPPGWAFAGCERIAGGRDPYVRWRACADGQRGARIVSEGQPTQADAIADLRERIAREFGR